MSMEKLVKDFGEIARRMLGAYSQSKTVFADKMIRSLSIEEKEKVLKLRGLVDENLIKSIVAETEQEVVARMQKVADEKAAAAAAAAAATERQEATLRAEAKATDVAEAASAAPPPPPSPPPPSMPSSELAKEFEELGYECGLSELDEDPVLGVLLYRLGKRSLYLMDVPSLYTTPVWEKQRVYRQVRAKRIAQTLKNKKEATGAKEIQLPGVIALYERAWEPPLPPLPELRRNPQALADARRRYGIVDGQHRVGAVGLLHAEGHFHGRVLVEVFQVANEVEIAVLFADINKAEPVKDVDMPYLEDDEHDGGGDAAYDAAAAHDAAAHDRDTRGGEGGGGGGEGEGGGPHAAGAVRSSSSSSSFSSSSSSSAAAAAAARRRRRRRRKVCVELERDIIDSACAALEGKYKAMFSGSARPNKPHLNVDNLRDALFQARVIEAKDMRSDADLLGWLLERNDELAARSDEEWRAAGVADKSRGRVLDKAKKHAFFLGLDEAWLMPPGDFED